jgi:hypothetical protein
MAAVKGPWSKLAIVPNNPYFLLPVCCRMDIFIYFTGPIICWHGSW